MRFTCIRVIKLELNERESIRPTASQAENTKEKKRLCQWSPSGPEQQEHTNVTLPAFEFQSEERAWRTVSGGSTIIIIYAGSAFGLGPIAY